MNILFLTDTCFSAATPNAICTMNVAEELVKLGHAVFFIAYSSEQTPPHYNGFTFYYIKPSFARIMLNISKKKKSFSSLFGFIGITANRLRRLLLLPFYPIVSFSVPIKYRNKYSEVIRCNRIDTVVSVIAPDETLLAGHLIKKRFPEIKFVTYYLDCGTNINQGSSFVFLKKILQSKAIRMENRLLRSADNIIVMKGHSNYYKKTLAPENQGKIHIADVPLLAFHFPLNASFLSSTNDSIEKWIYTGNMEGRIYNPIPFCKLFEEYHKLNPNSELHLYGVCDNRRFFSEVLSKNDFIKWHNSVPHSSIYSIQHNASVLILFKCFSMDSISGKIFEYLPHLKPIILLSPANDICSRQLSQYSLSLSLDISDSSINNAQKAFAFLSTINSIHKPSIDDIRRVFSLSLPLTTAKLLLS